MRRPIIERRFRRELRDLKLNPRKEVFLVRTGTVEQRVARGLLSDLFSRRVRITLVPSSTRKRRNVYLPTSLENELTRELRSFLEDETDGERDYRRGERRFVPLMASIPEEEIFSYAQRHGLKGKMLAAKDDVRELLEALQKAQPQTKAALRRSFGHFRAAAGKGPQRL
jgi:hypothetical protein